MSDEEVEREWVDALMRALPRPARARRGDDDPADAALAAVPEPGLRPRCCRRSPAAARAHPPGGRLPRRLVHGDGDRVRPGGRARRALGAADGRASRSAERPAVRARRVAPQRCSRPRSGSGSRRSAARRRTSATSATRLRRSAGAGWTTTSSPISSRSAQFLPGPASSQLGFAIGMLRAGPLGGLAAWLGFTLPSAVALIAFAYGVGGAPTSPARAGCTASSWRPSPWSRWRSGRWARAGPRRGAGGDRRRRRRRRAGARRARRPAARDRGRRGARASAAARRPGRPAATADRPRRSRRRGAIAAVALALALLVALPLARRATDAPRGLDERPASTSPVRSCSAAATSCCRCCTPAPVEPGWVDEGDFVAGYGAAQAVPGPLFTFAALPRRRAGPGAERRRRAARSRWWRSSCPGCCCWSGVAPFWTALRTRPGSRGGAGRRERGRGRRAAGGAVRPLATTAIGAAA